LSGFNFSYLREIASEQSENERKDGSLLHVGITREKVYELYWPEGEAIRDAEAFFGTCPCNNFIS
jgi:hypothetical protein